ncbi:MAG: protocatechuate 3,4-dioxygenase subunit alpha [bacterium]|nr:protocatechuate 3,4-dioxygenase subunit alpha [bacterium]
MDWQPLIQTPSQTVGPFFHDGLFTRSDQHILVTNDTRGQRILITGQVIDGDGAAIPDAMLEIWQADAGGHFRHPADPDHALADPNFRYFGRSSTRDGTFLFKTIKPGRVTYDAARQQSPHVNIRVFARGMLTHLYTRLYFSDEAAANADDPTLNRVDADRRATLIAQRQPGDDLPTYCLDIHLQGDDETVFFEP